MLHIDTGNTGFMLLCTSLVMLMTPGLAFFYGGLVGRKNCPCDHDPELRLDGLDDGVWFVCGFSLCFSGDVGGVIGNLDHAFLRGISLDTAIPE
jgi:Amt family ammonium transporter